MAAPKVPIEVDGETGVWRTDGLPMLYLPRHFFINNHLAVESALGRRAYATLLYESGFRSAWQWCEQEARTHGLAGVAVFHHYMTRISQRGWGLFTVEEMDEKFARARIRVDHSAFVLGRSGDAGQAGGQEQSLCYMFGGWFPGALAWVGNNLGSEPALTCSEVRCAGEGGQEFCLFQTTPA